MTMTQEERISRLEGSYEVLVTMAENMVTKDELRASVDMLQAQIVGTAETLQAQQLASEEKLRAEMRAMEVRIVRWMVGTILAATAIGVTAISGAVAVAFRLLT